MDFDVIIGILGLGLILIAFVLNLIYKVNSKSKLYLWLNIIGSGLLAYYALILGSIPFFILQIVWGLSSLVKLFHVMKNG